MSDELSTGVVCWKRTLAGRNPSRVLVLGSTVVCSYIDNQGNPGTPGRHRALCLDLDGGERWSVRDFELRVALPDGRLLGTTHSGELRALDSNGRKAGAIRASDKKMRIKGVIDVRMSSKRVLVRTEEELFVADVALNLIGRFSTSTQGMPVVVEDSVLYIERDRIVRRDRQGNVTRLCEIPTALAYEAMSRWERETGRPALEGHWIAKVDPSKDFGSEVVAAIDDPSKQKAFGLGDRAPHFAWVLSHIEATNTLYLSNCTSPHVLVCLGLDGVAKWSAYLSSGCCGGSPASLPNGELVVSSGCGGILSWLDSTGRVTHRAPDDQNGSPGMFSSQVTALRDSSCVVSGAGVACFTPDGALRWQWTEGCSCFDYDERLGLLVTADWSNDKKKSVSISGIKSLDRRGARA